jgi:hypothetical protein
MNQLNKIPQTLPLDIKYSNYYFFDNGVLYTNDSLREDAYIRLVEEQSIEMKVERGRIMNFINYVNNGDETKEITWAKTATNNYQ